jgi:hypothetical protein
MRTMNPVVFISYSFLDIKIAKKISTFLKDNKVEVWFDQWKIFPGDNFIDKIEEGLKSVDYLLLLLSKNSLRSNWVKNEWQCILNCENSKNTTKIIPLKIDNSDVPFILSNKLYVDLSIDFESELYRLIGYLKSEKTGNIELNDPKYIIDAYEKIKKQSETRRSSITIELKIDRPFDEYSKEEQNKLINDIGIMLKTGYNIEIKNILKGSVRIQLILELDEAKHLKSLVDQGYLDYLNVTEANILFKVPVSISNQNEITSKDYSDEIPQGNLENNNKNHISIDNKPHLTDDYNKILSYLQTVYTTLRIKESNERITLRFKIQYCNSESNRMLMNLFILIERIYMINENVEIIWYYDKGDDIMYDNGEIFKSLIEVPFKLMLSE